ncbi:MAG: peptide ABC transporter substrate-binding protein [Spirochaetaceae bacterium]|nr:MAG: peptide ABC transporter substrate-binding protein [Spirochaetaceae bacterium]
MRFLRGLLVPLLAICIAGAATAGTGSDEFVVSFIDSGIQFNPIFSYTATEAQIYTAIYEGLVGYDPLTMEPVPGVAERWDISSDGRTYTFHLRRTARYWNGDSVTADDFRRTWLRLIDPEADAAYNFLFDIIKGVREYRTGANPDPQSVGLRAPDPHTFEVELRTRASHFVRILAHHAFVPVHSSVRDVRDWSGLREIPGNGPYRIVERGEGVILLERNRHYWDARNVSIPRMRFLLFADDDETVTRRFNDGEIDWVTGGMSLMEVDNPRHIVVNPLFATTYYFMRSDREPFSDPRVRRALALLVPWETVRDPEIQFIPSSVLVPSIPYYPPMEGITTRDRDEALALLEEAGYRQGVRIPTITIHIPRGTESTRVAEIMKKAWEEALHVSVDIVSTPYPDYFESLRDSDFTVGTVSWIGDFADPLTFLQMWISDSNVNDAGFSDSRYDDLLDEAMGQAGITRYETLARAEEILLQTGTVMPVSHSPAINLIDLQGVDGWYPNPLDMHPVKYLKFTDRAPAPGVIRFRY